MRRFTLTGAKSQELDRLVSQHKQVTAEVDALQKQLLDLRKENDDLQGKQDEFARQADVLRHKADELDVERGRLSGELTQALRRVQAAEDGNVRLVHSESCTQPNIPQGLMQELQAAQAELARLRAGGQGGVRGCCASDHHHHGARNPQDDARTQRYIALASRALEVLGVLASDAAPQQATIAKAHAGRSCCITTACGRTSFHRAAAGVAGGCECRRAGAGSRDCA